MRVGDIVKVQGKRGTYILKKYVPDKEYWELTGTEKGDLHAAASDRIKPTVDQRKMDRLVERVIKNATVRQYFAEGRSLGLRPEQLGARLWDAINEAG